MIDYLLQNDFDDDPMLDFTRSYNMRDVIMDIGAAWATIDAKLIHKCFEKLLCPEDYEKQYNETYNVNVQWPGINFRGFRGTDNDNSVAGRAQKIQDFVNRLNNMQSHVSIDCDSVVEAIEYDPNEDLDDTSELIQNGFYSQRVSDGLVSDENDLVTNISQKKRETLKALANIPINFRTEDFQSKEEAEQAYIHLKGLQDIFRGMKDRDNRTASSILTPPRRPSSRSPSPGPTTSGITTFRPSRVSPLPSENITLDDVNWIHVSLDGEPDVTASPSAAASTSAAALDDESNTSDGVLHVFEEDNVQEVFGDPNNVVREAAASAAAASASATANQELSISITYDDNEPIITRFTALNTLATSSPSPRHSTARTSPSPESRPLNPVATSSPSPTRPIARPKHSGVRQSTCMYTEFSDDDLSTSGDEAYIPN